ncbi:MAG TPA: maltotransferase domain-containing protein [Stellaceae bacterium]
MPAGSLRIYNLFPSLVGPIARWRAELPRIAAMGFNAVFVNPFHYPGFSGSLYAVKDYYLLNPLFRGDAREGDDALLAGFAEDCRRHGLVAMMDLVVNHTARDSELVTRHPHWFAHEPGGGVRSPSAIDPADATNVTVWGDLAEIEYRGDGAEVETIAYFQDVVRHYAGLGFGGFRCDAAYKVPNRVWRALIGAARAAAPDSVFCAETLGARLEEVRRLDGAGFDYLFNSAKWWDFESPWLLEQYEMFRGLAPSIAFPESHDTERLAAELGRAGITDPVLLEMRYRQAYAFAACFSAGVMMPLGYEFGWSRRLDVVKTRPTSVEGKRFDLSPYIAAVNAMKRDTPALNEEGPQQRLTPPSDPVAVLARRCEAGDEWAFTLVNSDDEAAQEIELEALLTASDGEGLVLDDVTPGETERGVALRLVVQPAEVRMLRGRRAARAAAPSAGAPARPAGSAHPHWSPLARILIEDVYPELGGGRFPVKRIVGDTLQVWADILRDGHDKLRAELLYRPESAGEWCAAPMRLFDNDRWVGEAPLNENGRYRYTIEAWTDHFASWRADTLKKREAGQALDLELIESRALVAEAAARAGGPDRTLLDRVLREFDQGDTAARAALMLSRLLDQAMARWPDRGDATRYPYELEVMVDRPRARFGAWYEMFLRSQGREPGGPATFDDGIARLPEIQAMGFDVVYLPPIHPIGRTNRKGRDNSLTAKPGDPGSPYAIGAVEGGHDAVHPELGGMAGFRRFVAAVRERGMEVALDFAIQCAPDHPWVKQHPDWFIFRPDGTIKYAENPPKKYQDIVNVDFYNSDREGLWRALRDVVLFWIGEGVTIFRVDNPHTKPLPFWEWLIREVQHRHPEAIFLAEAFTRPKMMRALAKAGFTQSYTYFTWRVTKQELTDYGSELAQGASKEYLRPNFFANTPDILPVHLQQGGRPIFRIRLVLAATLASTYGIYNGFELCEARAVPGTEEYLHSEKYEYKVWDWDRPGHIKDEIARLNRIRRDNPALHELTNLRFYPAQDDRVLFYGKMTADRSNMIFVAVNLDPMQRRDAVIELPLGEMHIPEVETFTAVELFTGTEHRWQGARQRLTLDPEINPAAIFRIAR